MNILKTASSLLAALAANSLALAQAYEFVGVIKGSAHLQTSATTTVLDPFEDFFGLGATPYDIDIFVVGSNLAGITPPSISGPIVVQEATPGFPDAAFYNGGTLVFQTDGNEGAWGFGAPNGDSWGAASKEALDAAFPNGTYSLTVAGETFDLALSADTYPEIPLLTLTGGTWEEGRYLVDEDTELTITATFSEYGTHELDALSLSMISYTDGTFTGIDDFFLSAEDPLKNSHTLTIPAGTLTAGKTYEVEAGFTAIVDLQTSEALGEGIAVAGFERYTFLEIVATPLPEPPDTGPIETTIGVAHVVKFQTVENVIYTLQASNDMEFWYDLIPFIYGDGSMQSYFFESGPNDRFYRAIPVEQIGGF